MTGNRGNRIIERKPKTHMIPNPKIGAIVFYVKDIARTEKFYRDVLGLKTTLNPGHGGEGEAHDPWMIARTGSCRGAIVR